MTAPDLLPCDFCGNDDIQDWGENTWSRPVKWMYCTECHAQGPRVMLERNESEEAWRQRIIAAWNTRATPAAMTPEVRALAEALKALEKTATEVSRRGAETGPQWTKLTVALLQARAALTQKDRTDD